MHAVEGDILACTMGRMPLKMHDLMMVSHDCPQLAPYTVMVFFFGNSTA
jgi:hypothetical protein